MRPLLDASIDLSHSLSRGLTILECIAASQTRVSASEIQKLTGIPNATLFRLLNILKGFGYVRYVKETKKYYLGPSVLHMGFAVLQNFEGREILRPLLHALAFELKKSVGLLFLDGNEMVYLERVRTPIPIDHALDFHFSVGTRIPVYPSASGKAILAYLDPKKLHQIAVQAKKKGIDVGKKSEKLFNCLTEVRRQGYAIYDNELNNGVRAIAVPVFSYEGIVYSINVIVRYHEVSVDELRQMYAPKLVAAGKEASKLLGALE